MAVCTVVAVAVAVTVCTTVAVAVAVAVAVTIADETAALGHSEVDEDRVALEVGAELIEAEDVVLAVDEDVGCSVDEEVGTLE